MVFLILKSRAIKFFLYFFFYINTFFLKYISLLFFVFFEDFQHKNVLAEVKTAFRKCDDQQAGWPGPRTNFAAFHPRAPGSQDITCDNNHIIP